MKHSLRSFVRKHVSSRVSPRAFGIAKRAFGAVLAALLLYAVAATIFIRAGGLASVVSGSVDEISMLQLDGGYSVVPGKIVADRFVLRFDDSSVQFELVIEQFEVTVDLLSLVQREFRASELGGVAWLSFAKKVKSTEGQEKRLAAFPKIAGLARAVKDETTSEVGDQDPDTWVVDVRDIDLTARELWIVEYRYVGQARIRGDFLIQPERRFVVRDAHIAHGSGTLGVGERGIARSLEGTVTGGVEEHDPDGEGVSIVDHLTLAVDLKANGARLERPLGLYPSVAGHGIRSSDARIHVDAAIDKGTLRRGGTIRFEAGEVSASIGSIRIAGSLRARGKVEGDGVVAVDVASPAVGFSSSKSTSKVKGPGLEDVELAAMFTAPRVDAKWDVGRASASIAEMTAPDLRWLNAPLGTTRFTSGRASGKLDVTRRPSGALEGSLSMGVKGAGIKVSDSTVILSGTVEIDEPVEQTAEGYAMKRVALRLDDVAMADDPEERWWLSAVSHDAVLRSDGEFKATFHIGGQSAEPLLPLLVKSSILETTAKGLLDLDETDGVLSIARTSSHIRVGVERFTSGDLSAEGLLVKVNDVTCGAFLVTTPYADIGVDVRPREGVSISPFSGKEWLSAQLARPCRTND